MVRRLVANVTLLGEDGLAAHFPVGTSFSEVPTWAAERITNPAVWDKEPEPAKADEAGAESVAAPPKSGAGSGLKAWVEYALSQGVVVDDDSKRDDVIAACEAAGVPTE